MTTVIKKQAVYGVADDDSFETTDIARAELRAEVDTQWVKDRVRNSGRFPEKSTRQAGQVRRDIELLMDYIQSCRQVGQL
jgi:hypothetical protein